MNMSKFLRRKEKKREGGKKEGKKERQYKKRGENENTDTRG